ncbi:Uncharacterized protein GBIM_05846 [Gryllus bimaculatus]|nr:Uncharacterized protein GBIM_05846 [Gryllus bimaculatus]
MKETYEMSWKPPKRTLQNVPKVKLTYGHPLPENVDDATPVNDIVGAEQSHFQFSRNGAWSYSNFNSTLPVASQTLEESYLDRFNKISEFDQEDDSDLEQTLFSEFGGTDGSSLDNSSASFLSWADEIEVQGAAKTRELFEELEMALYGEESAKVKDEELSSECMAWKSSHIYLRVIGKQPSFVDSTSVHLKELVNEYSGDNEEVIASHGFVEDFLKIETSAESGDSLSTPSSDQSGNLTEKVKTTALEQLTFHALSEALKSFEQDQCREYAEVRQNIVTPPAEDAVSTLANLSEDLGRALQISGRSIHRSPKTLNSEMGKKMHISGDQTEPSVQPKRFLSNINVIPEDKIYITPENSFAVLGFPKPLNSDFFNTKTKMLEKRGFHSAADRKRPGILDRRFSCISPEYDKLLKPSHENEDNMENSSVIVNSKQISAPNTPLKLLRHLTLPPIQNLNSFNKISENSHEKSQSSLTHIRRIFVKNKVSLSPLPNTVNISGGVNELQLAKKLLDSTPDSGRWSSCRKIGFTGIQNAKSRKKGLDNSYFDNL